MAKCAELAWMALSGPRPERAEFALRDLPLRFSATSFSDDLRSR
jgi:hypothetical protein